MIAAEIAELQRKRRDSNHDLKLPTHLQRRRSSTHLEQAERDLADRAQKILERTEGSLYEKELNCEYYGRLSQNEPNRKPTFPAVAVKGDRLIKQYGTSERDVTREYYDDDEPKDTSLPTYGAWPRNRRSSFKAKMFEGAKSGRQHIVNEVRKFLRGENKVRTDSEDPKKLMALRREKTTIPHQKRLGNINLRRTQTFIDDVNFLRGYLTQNSSKQKEVDNNPYGSCALPSITIGKTGPTKSTGMKNDLGLGLQVATANQLKDTEPQKEPSKFEMRREYGKNLERNWYRDFVKKNREQSKEKFDLRLEMFYSPDFYEEVSDSDNMSAAGSVRGELSNDRENSEITADRKKSFLDGPEELFSSTDVLMGEKGELERETPLDIEIILDGNRLIEKRSKHKMHKKRRRKERKFQQMMMSENVNGKNNSTSGELTDVQLRALRLNLRKKDTKSVTLRGKRRFIQVVNVVRIFLHFTKILRNIRERKKRERRQKRKRLKRVKWEEKEENPVIPEEPEIVPTLKEKFMNEIGASLLRDVMSVNFNDNDNKLTPEEPIDQDKGIEKKNLRSRSLFAEVVEQCTIDDASSCQYRKPGHLRRSKSFSDLLPRPSKFQIVFTEKPKRRKRDRSKSVLRNRPTSNKPFQSIVSPAPTTCSCNRGHHRSESRRRAPSQSRMRCDHIIPKEKVSNVKTIDFHREEALGRRASLSLSDLRCAQGIEFEALLSGIDIPAKDIKIEIIKRKLRKQKERKLREKLMKYAPPPVQTQDTDDTNIETNESEEESDYLDDEPNIYQRSPYVYAGVSWNYKPRRSGRPWTMDDVEREVRRVTRLFLDMKDCSYLRLSSFHQAIVGKVNQSN